MGSNQRRGTFTTSRSTHCGDLTAGTIARTAAIATANSKNKRNTARKNDVHARQIFLHCALPFC